MIGVNHGRPRQRKEGVHIPVIVLTVFRRILVSLTSSCYQLLLAGQGSRFGEVAIEASNIRHRSDRYVYPIRMTRYESISDQQQAECAADEHAAPERASCDRYPIRKEGFHLFLMIAQPLCYGSPRGQLTGLIRSPITGRLRRPTCVQTHVSERVSRHSPPGPMATSLLDEHLEMREQVPPADGVDRLGLVVQHAARAARGRRRSSPPPVRPCPSAPPSPASCPACVTTAALPLRRAPRCQRPSQSRTD